MSVTVTAAQRDALQDQLLDRLSGIGDIEVAIQAERHSDAERIRCEYSDDLLLLGNLGIGAGDGKPVELTLPPEVLLRILPRLQETALNHTDSLEPERLELREMGERNRLVAEACKSVLARLDGAASVGQ
jgi:hypothetical protein